MRGKQLPYQFHIQNGRNAVRNRKTQYLILNTIEIMKKSIFLLLFSVFFLSGTFAQTKQESIKELIHIMRNDSLMNKTIDAMIPSMVNQMQSEKKDSTGNVRTMEVAKIAMESAKEAMPKMMDDMTSTYDKYFTEQEIKDFITFYKSPSGQKYINVMPEMMKDLMGNMMKNYVPAMKKSMDAKMEKLKEQKKK